MHFFSFDADYLRRLREGDPVVEEHFVRYFTELLRIKLLRSRVTWPAANDIVQETFRRVLDTLRSPRSIESPGGFGAYVVQVCNNVIHEQYREQARREPLDDDYAETPTNDPDAEESLLTGEVRARVQRTLKSLKDKDQQILRALFVDEKSKDDVCEEFGIERDYLRVVLHRAKVQFRLFYLNEKG